MRRWAGALLGREPPADGHEFCTRLNGGLGRAVVCIRLMAIFSSAGAREIGAWGERIVASGWGTLAVRDCDQRSRTFSL